MRHKKSTWIYRLRRFERALAQFFVISEKIVFRATLFGAFILGAVKFAVWLVK